MLWSGRRARGKETENHSRKRSLKTPVNIEFLKKLLVNQWKRREENIKRTHIASPKEGRIKDEKKEHGKDSK